MGNIPWNGMGQHALHFPCRIMNDNECQNDYELLTLLNFEVNKVNQFCRFVSLLVRVVLSSTHYT